MYTSEHGKDLGETRCDGMRKLTGLPRTSDRQILTLSATLSNYTSLSPHMTKVFQYDREAPVVSWMTSPNHSEAGIDAELSDGLHVDNGTARSTTSRSPFSVCPLCHLPKAHRPVGRYCGRDKPE